LMAVTRSSGWNDDDHSTYLLEVVDSWIKSNEEVEAYASKVLRGVK